MDELVNIKEGDPSREAPVAMQTRMQLRVLPGPSRRTAAGEIPTPVDDVHQPLRDVGCEGGTAEFGVFVGVDVEVFYALQPVIGDPLRYKHLVSVQGGPKHRARRQSQWRVSGGAGRGVGGTVGSEEGGDPVGGRGVTTKLDVVVPELGAEMTACMHADELGPFEGWVGCLPLDGAVSGNGTTDNLGTSRGFVIRPR